MEHERMETWKHVWVSQYESIVSIGGPEYILSNLFVWLSSRDSQSTEYLQSTLATVSISVLEMNDMHR